MHKDTEMLATSSTETTISSLESAKGRHPDRRTTVIYKENFQFIQNIQHQLSAEGQSIDHGILSSAALDIVSRMPDAQEQIIQRSLEIMMERRRVKGNS